MHRPPREGLGCFVDEDGPYDLLLGHAMGCRQASLGTPVPRTPTTSSPNPSSSLVSNLVSKPQIGTFGLLVVLVTPCS